MTVEIKIPEVAEGVSAGTVVALSVKVGDEVTPDQTVLELETDKAVVGIPTEQAGVIAEILVAEGDRVDIGTTVMKLDARGESDTPPTPSRDVQEDRAAQSKKEDPTKTDSGPDTGVEAEEVDDEKEYAAQHVSPTTPQDPSARPAQDVAAQPEAPSESVEMASEPARSVAQTPGEKHIAAAAPSVRRLARELGVDIHQVQGTGPRGRISADDVQQFVKATMQRVTGGGLQSAEFPGLHAQRPLPDFSRFGAVSREPLSRIRELTADAMNYAWSTIPMVTQYDKLVIGPVEEFRQQFNSRAAAEEKLTVTAFLVKVCAAALKAFPQFNSALDLASRELVLQHYVNIGVAVDTPNGLLVPVLRGPDAKGVKQIACELNTLAEKTRKRKVKPEELEGGTFTISNLGGIGGTAFTPIVYAPQVAILGVSRSETQPVWNGQEFVAKRVMPLSLTYDHRVIDGADGARFLRWICAALENPWQMVM